MKFEELYKKARDKDQISLNEVAIWKEIELRLEKPKRKRRFFWIWGLGVISLISFGTLLFILNTTQSNQHTQKTSQTITTPLYESNTELSTSLDDDQINTEYTPVNSGIQKASEINTSQIPASSILNTSNLKKSVQKPLIAFSTITQENSDLSFKGSLLSYEETHQNATTKIRSNEEQSSKDITNPKIILPITTQTELHDNRLLTIQEIPFLELNLNPHFRNILEIHEVSFAEPSDKSGKNLEFVIALGYLQHSYTLRDIGIPPTSWSDLHGSSKSTNFGLEFDALLRYSHRSGFFVGTGLRLRVLSEWYDAVVTTETPFTLPSDSAIYYQINGIKEYVPGSISATEIQRTKYHTPVRRMYLDIPLELGFRKKWGHWRLTPSLSYNLNLAHQYFGRSFNTEAILLNSQELREGMVYNSSFVHSANFRLGIAYEVSRKSSVGLNLNYWQQFSSSITEVQGIEERYSGYGIGIQYLMRL